MSRNQHTGCVGKTTTCWALPVGSCIKITQQPHLLSVVKHGLSPNSTVLFGHDQSIQYHSCHCLRYIESGGSSMQRHRSQTQQMQSFSRRTTGGSPGLPVDAQPSPRPGQDSPAPGLMRLRQVQVDRHTVTKTALDDCPTPCTSTVQPLQRL